MTNLAASPSPAVARSLPLRATRLDARAEGGIVRYVLEQRFANPHAEPLHLTYKLPLPDEAAVVGFAFAIGDRTIVGEVESKARARERFDDAIVEGRTAALLEEERSTLFTQEIGNVAPGTEVVAKITIDALLVFVAGGRGAWELRFPTTLAPRYLGESGRVIDAEAISISLAEAGPAPRMSLALAVGDTIAEARSPESPSHALQCARGEGGTFHVALGGSGDTALDRDLVVRWDATTDDARLLPVVHEETSEDALYALVAVVPPRVSTRAEPRDLTILLDTSGSMGGEPLAQAKRFATALVDALGDEDTVHLVEFSSDVRSFRSAAAPAIAATKRDAIAWIGRLSASGGTEMRTGILRALGDARPGRTTQVVLVTDGLIGFEQEIVSAIHRDNVHGARVHTVGVGSAVNRSLLAPAARAGRGIEIVCGVGEDVEPLVARLVARTSRPLATGVTIERVTAAGPLPVACAKEKIADLYAEGPSLVPVRLPREGGIVRILARTADGPFVRELRIVSDGIARPHVRALYGREAVRDVEMRLAAGASDAREGTREIERLGLAFRIVTKETSFVAVDSVATVEPTAPTRHEVVAHALPFGMTAEGAGLRRPSGTVLAQAKVSRGGPMAPPPPPRPGSPAPARSSGGAPPAPKGAPPPRDEVAKKKESSRDAAPPSLLERARRAILGAPPAESAPAPEPAPAEAEEAASEGARGHGRARVRKIDRGRIVIEVSFDREVELRAARLELVLVTGKRITISMDNALSTAPGTYAAGLVLRFAGAFTEGGPIVAGDLVMLVVETATARLEARF